MNSDISLCQPVVRVAASTLQYQMLYNDGGSFLFAGNDGDSGIYQVEGNIQLQAVGHRFAPFAVDFLKCETCTVVVSCSTDSLYVYKIEQTKNGENTCTMLQRLIPNERDPGTFTACVSFVMSWNIGGVKQDSVCICYAETQHFYVGRIRLDGTTKPTSYEMKRDEAAQALTTFQMMQQTHTMDASQHMYFAVLTQRGTLLYSMTQNQVSDINPRSFPKGLQEYLHRSRCFKMAIIEYRSTQGQQMEIKRLYAFLAGDQIPSQGSESAPPKMEAPDGNQGILIIVETTSKDTNSSTRVVRIRFNEPIIEIKFCECHTLAEPFAQQYMMMQNYSPQTQYHANQQKVSHRPCLYVLTSNRQNAFSQLPTKNAQDRRSRLFQFSGPQLGSKCVEYRENSFREQPLRAQDNCQSNWVFNTHLQSISCRSERKEGGGIVCNVTLGK